MAKAELLRNPCGGTIVFLLFGEFVTPGIVAPVRNAEFLFMIVDENTIKQIKKLDIDLSAYENTLETGHSNALTVFYNI